MDGKSQTTEPTAAQVNAAAAKWCRDKERETDMDDIRYFKGQWRSLPGLRVYVEREVAGYAE
jgi:hypothetical protein